jgi:DNA-binding NarL/FixJ family response regulator
MEKNTHTHSENEYTYTSIPTLIIAMSDRAFAEMISEWHFNRHFRTLAILEDCSSITNRVEKLTPDYLFVDLDMQNFDWLHLIKKIEQQNLTTKIIMYASKRISLYLRIFLENSNQNIRGFIHKGSGIEDIENCIEEVFSGRRFLSAYINNYLNDRQVDNSNFDIDFSKLELLSKREKEVWVLLTKGKTEREIGEILFIGLATVKTYKKGIKDKLGILGNGKLTYIALTFNIK